MDLIYTNPNKEDVGVLHDYEFDLAFGADENDFECQVQLSAHCCEPGAFLYIEGTEYGGVIDSIEVDTEAQLVTYSGRTWHGILANSVIEPPVGVVESESAVSKLPEGFTQLAFIQSTGTQYINTGYIPNSSSRVVADVGFENVTAAMHIFGARTAAANAAFSCSIYYAIDGAFQSEYGTNVVRPTTTWNGRHLIDKNKNVFTLDGTATTQTAQSFTCTYPLYVFTTNNGGSTHAEMCKMKLYSMQVYDNGTLVRDFIPCKNASGEIGLYDTVNAAFYGNAGTGTFGGAEEGKLPEGYTKLAYIESTGTQCINTGFKPNQDTRLVLDAQFTSSANSQFMFGCRTSSYTVNYSLLISSGALRSSYGSSNVSASGLVLADRYAIDKNKNICTLNGTAITNAESTFQSELELFLCACNQGGTASYFGSMKVWECQIYDNGNLVRNFIPCMNSSGEVGLYDLVNGTFYGNAGTGTFYGVESRKLPNGFTQLEYIESTGKQYVDTGYKPNQDTKVVMDVQSVSSNPNETGTSFFGARTSSSSKCYGVYWHRNNVTYYSFYNAGYTQSASELLTERLAVTQDKNVTTVKDIIIERTYAAFQCDYNLYLFTMNNGGTAQYFGLIRVYGCKIYDNGTLIRDYVPCTNASGVVGLYDMVNAVFYADAAGGTFTAGAEVVVDAVAYSDEDTTTEETQVNTYTHKYDYYVVSGDAHRILEELIDYLGLGDVFTANPDESVIDVGKYSFRYVDAYKGIRNMLAAFNGKLKMEFHIDTVVLSAVYLADYSNDEEFDASQVDFNVKKNFRPLNHLICLGTGNLKDRHVIHLFADENGGVQPYKKVDKPVCDDDYILDTSHKVLKGLEEVAEVYDYPSAQTTENYIPLAEQPDDWSENYGQYFKRNSETNSFEKVVGKTKTMPVLLTAQPEDWEENYAKYFVVEDEKTKAVKGDVTEEYVELTEKPSDWEENYGNYYYLFNDGTGDEYEKVSSKSTTNYECQTQQPDDWDYNFKNYYERSKTEGMVRVGSGSATCPTWTANKYYTQISGKNAPEWVSNTYYEKVSDGTPTWTANKYYTQVSTTAAPAWSSDVACYAKVDSKTEEPDEYVKLTEKPVDWEDNYSDYYYVYSDGTTEKYKKVQGVTTKSYQVQTQIPTDWASNYDKYYEKDSSGEYVRVEETYSYVKLSAKPSDWESDYDNYYYVYTDGTTEEYKKVSGTSEKTYQLQTQAPSDWNSNWGRYYEKDSDGEYVKIVGDVPGCPMWMPRKYYTKESDSTAPAWSRTTTYYECKKETVAPEWVADTYYTKEKVTITPSFASNVFFELKLDHYAQLVAGGLEKMNEAFNCNSIKVDLDLEGEYDIGDIVGAYESITEMAVWQPISKKIVNIHNGVITISYKVGD